MACKDEMKKAILELRAEREMTLAKRLDIAGTIISIFCVFSGGMLIGAGYYLAGFSYLCFALFFAGLSTLLFLGKYRIRSRITVEPWNDGKKNG